MTDNGASRRSRAFVQALGEGDKHKKTRPYRPQTTAKVERANRTLDAEWAYARTYADETEQAESYEMWVHDYNFHRPYTGIGGLTLSVYVHNRTGKYS